MLEGAGPLSGTQAVPRGEAAMSPAVPEDEGLAIAATLAGDRAAFGLFVERYGQRAYRAAAFMLGPARAEADDVVQDAFVDALQGLRTYRSLAPFYPWFHAILRRATMRHMRRHRPRAAAPYEEPSTPPRVADAELAWALARLTFHKREVLLLHHVLGYGVNEIAHICRVSAGTVKSRLYHARREMAALLGEAEDRGSHTRP